VCVSVCVCVCERESVFASVCGAIFKFFLIQVHISFYFSVSGFSLIYVVATVSGIDKIIGLFRRIASLL